MTVFTHIANGWMTGGLPYCYNAVMATIAWSDHLVMINIDTTPVGCTCVAILAIVAGRHMVCRFSRCNTAVVAGYTYRRHDSVIHYCRRPSSGVMTIFAGVGCRDVIPWFASGGAAVMTGNARIANNAVVHSGRYP